MYPTPPRRASHLPAINAAVLLLPLPLTALVLAYPPPFSPTQPIYANNLFSLLLAPWSPPSSFLATMSRLIQAGLLVGLPPNAGATAYALWIPIAAARTLSGFLLSRSVGWAYPALFNHYALYETSAGLGPALVAYLILEGTHICAWSERALGPLLQYGRERAEVVLVVLLAFALCAMDGAPWTYVMAALCAMCIALARVFVLKNEYERLLPTDQPQRQPPRIPAIFLAVVLSLFAISIPRIALSWITPAPPVRLDWTASAPLLDILVLSYPRPAHVDLSAPTSILSTTIASYLPLLFSPHTTLSVFSHTNDHPAFAHAQAKFADTPRVEFYTDGDSHAEAVDGQYLHVAEALRWAGEKQDGKRAEWVMLVEDDFPLCGKWGMDGVRRVLVRLQNTRNDEGSGPARYGGFVGTGGSGLVIHHTLLPILSLLLRTHASLHAPPPVRRPADLVIQDCLLGRDPLCPQTGMVVSSRMLMDHIGGAASTREGQRYDADKWRCGWRHPFHGWAEVDVVVV